MRNATGPWLVVIAAITLFCAWLIFKPDDVKFFDREIKVRPGLDISGGLRVLMQAEQSGVTADQMDQARTIIANRVNALGVSEPVVQVAGTNRIIVELPDIKDPDQARSLIQQTALLEFVDFRPSGSCSINLNAGTYILTTKQIEIKNQRAANAVATPSATQAATAAATGAATPASTSAATQASTPAATPVATQAATQAATAAPTTAATPAATAAPTAAATPAAAAVGTANNPAPNPCTGDAKEPFKTVATGAALKSAEPNLNAQNATYVVNFTLNVGSKEADAFTGYTREAYPSRWPLAIVLDGKLLSAPQVQAELTDGGQITGNFDQAGARSLAIALKSGALPVSLRIESESQVGATLGAESVQASIRAGALGVIIVFLFLLVYYRVGGFAAALALIVFGAINFGLYKFIPVTLTLSAVVGFVISIGTAIDGNILIFERVKEELRAGRPLSKAIDLGFSRAWNSIRDSNISSIMIGFVLYFFGGQFGATTVRGFAVTLILGLTINMFTSLIVTRVFLEVILNIGGEGLRKIKLFGR